MAKIKDILILFASKSDEDTYSEIIKVLKKQKVDFDFKLASAHKDPDSVLKYIEEEYKVIISGAGLSAALPGFIASQVISPVIGVPCHGNYQGLDAFLSITQMPPGIPVLAVGVNQGRIAAENAVKMLRKYDSVNIIADEKTKAFDNAITILKKFEISFKETKEIDEKSINIEFVYFDEPIEKKDQLVIYCPLLAKEDDTAEAALNLWKHSNHGLWVGLNRGENAALAAIEILNINKDYRSQLIDYRNSLKK